MEILLSCSDYELSLFEKFTIIINKVYIKYKV